jgi:adenosine deaminase
MIDPSLPLIDLHRHLDGSIRLETILDLGRKHNLPLPAWDVDSLRPYIQVTEPQPGLMAFFEKFQWMRGVLVDYDACWRIAYENVEDLFAEGIDYGELRFSPWFMAEPFQLDAAGVVEAVVDGVESACRDLDYQVNLIGILSRHYGVDIAWKELGALLTQREHLIALDLAGDEANFPGAWFVEHIRRARDAGWQITVHAGEDGGPEAIWQAIQVLGAGRIGHAVQAVQDPALLDFMREQRIGIETNLTSNVQTSIVPDYAHHPLKKFLDAGLLATINTDDPGVSGITLAHEYQVAAPAAGLTAGEIQQAQQNSLEIAFLGAVEKAALAARRRGLQTDHG